MIYGFPAGPAPDGLLQLVWERGVAFAPALARHLELDRLLGNGVALAEPFMNVSLQADVRESYRSEKGLWPRWRTDLALGRERRTVMLQNLERFVKAGVHLVSVSDAGSVPGAFQGYASHSTQAWFEKAGLSGWDRLAAATTWPAAVLGHHVGFAFLWLSVCAVLAGCDARTARSPQEPSSGAGGLTDGAAGEGASGLNLGAGSRTGAKTKPEARIRGVVTS